MWDFLKKKHAILLEYSLNSEWDITFNTWAELNVVSVAFITCVGQTTQVCVITMEVADYISLINSSFVGDTVSVNTIISVYSWVMFGCVGQIVVMFGVGTNVINLVCFVKQGFKDQISISLTGRRIVKWDVGICKFLLTFITFISITKVAFCISV